MTSDTFKTDESRWQAVCNNNSNADGKFYYAVITTGIYCRPSCTSKLPKRNNVDFFKTPEQAEAAGYRPCKRCQPHTTSKSEEVEQKIVYACRIIEESDRHIKLDTLATQVGLSSYHFHRLFKKIVGVTPKQYSSNHLAKRFQNQLKDSPTVTDAIYSAGYNSNATAYDKKRNQLAMEPRVYRKGAAGVSIVYDITKCELGWLLVAATERGICAIELGDSSPALFTQLQKRFPKAVIEKASSDFIHLINKVIDFIQSPRVDFELPLDIQGTAFQQQVWSILKEIRPGQTMSYSEVAEKLGKPKAVRAVASACGSNRIAVVIPCHRVISKDGRLSGYRWGIERKKILLDKESTK